MSKKPMLLSLNTDKSANHFVKLDNSTLYKSDRCGVPSVYTLGIRKFRKKGMSISVWPNMLEEICFLYSINYPYNNFDYNKWAVAFW